MKDYVLDANAVLRYFGASEGQGTNKVRSACQNSDRSFVSLAYVLPGGSIQNREDAAKTDSPSAILSAKRATVAARPHQNSLSSVGRYKSVAFARDFLKGLLRLFDGPPSFLSPVVPEMRVWGERLGETAKESSIFQSR